MKNHNKILQQHLAEQIVLEEHLYKELEEQILEINDVNFIDAKNLLTNAKNVLESHFIELNDSLDELEKEDSDMRSDAEGSLTNDITHQLNNLQKIRKTSRILRDGYTALNLITTSNTLLHTIALALDSNTVATMALNHLEKLTPLVVKLEELMPVVVARELYDETPTIDLSIAQVALQNAKLAWRKACM